MAKKKVLKKAKARSKMAVKKTRGGSAKVTPIKKRPYTKRSVARWGKAAVKKAA